MPNTTTLVSTSAKLPLDGGPLIPLGAPLDPRRPLGGPRLRGCMGGGPRPKVGFVACSTLIGFPSSDF